MNPKSFRGGGGKTIGKALNYTVKNCLFYLKNLSNRGGTHVPSLGPVECGRCSLTQKTFIIIVIAEITKKYL